MKKAIINANGYTAYSVVETYSCPKESWEKLFERREMTLADGTTLIVTQHKEDPWEGMTEAELKIYESNWKRNMVCWNKVR